MKRFLLTSAAAALVFVGVGAVAPKSASATEVCYSMWEGETQYATTCTDTVYDVVGKTLLQYGTTPQNQQFLISVAKGQTQTLSESKTVEHKIETSASVSIKLPLFGKIGLATVGSTSGYSKTVYNTTTVYTGPDWSSPYNSRKYYAGAMYDLYNVTIHEYKYTRKMIDLYDGGNLLRTVESYWTEEVGTYNEQVRVPRAIEYTVDALY